MLEIVFLGTGGAVPSPRRHLAAIWMRYSSEEGESFLMDCGEGTQLQLMKAGLSFMQLDRIFITHWHADHWAGLIGLIQTMNLEGRKTPLRVYGPEAERFVDLILELGYWAPRFRVIPVDVPFEGDQETVVYQHPQFRIVSRPAKHSVPAVMYAFQEQDKVNVDIQKAAALGLTQGRVVGALKAEGKVVVRGRTVTLEEVGVRKPGLKAVYTGDTQACPQLVALARGADLLIHDSTYEAQEEDVMHAGAKEAAAAAKEAGVGTLVLTHFSRRYQDVSPLEQEARQVFPRVLSAKDFLKLTLKKGSLDVGDARPPRDKAA
ncbi:MAG: ribonuclease Z [Candidatus Aenigmarchaeota archaeon]|nr:ribonuclease Z [Candidatus Aenigmarchaeota archaeon]